MSRFKKGLIVGLVICLGLPFYAKSVFGEVIKSVPTSKRYVALTFDGGPSRAYTPEIIGTLARFGAHATFFVVGENAESCPEILREAVRMGNEIGNHSYNHPNLAKIGSVAAKRQLELTQMIIRRIIVRYRPVVMRPPYGAMNSQTASLAQSLGLKTIIWSVDPRDWKDPSPAEIARRVLRNIMPGDIVLLHDSHRNTALALPQILEGLRSKKLQCVTISELLK